MDKISILLTIVNSIFILIFAKYFFLQTQNAISENYKLRIKFNLFSQKIGFRIRHEECRINQIKSTIECVNNELTVLSKNFLKAIDSIKQNNQRIIQIELDANLNRNQILSVKNILNTIPKQLHELQNEFNKHLQQNTLQISQLTSAVHTNSKDILFSKNKLTEHLIIINDISLELVKKTLEYSEIHSNLFKSLNTSLNNLASLRNKLLNTDKNLNDYQTQNATNIDLLETKCINSQEISKRNKSQIQELNLSLKNQISEIIHIRELMGSFNFDKYLIFISQTRHEFRDISNRLSITQYTNNLTRSGLVIPKPPSNTTDADNIKWLETISRKDNFRNNLVYQSFDRQLNAFDLRQLEDHWLPKLNLTSLSRRALGYLAHNICLLEDRCRGRYATNIQDALIRALVVRSISLYKPVRILEIGTLFGINIVCLWDVCAGLNQSFEATVIDPLDGYYGSDLHDTITGLPVNENIFWSNIKAAQCPLTDIQLVKHLSTEKIALKSVKTKNFNCIIIDGDHSYDGISQDFNTYTDKLVSGGYLIIDDYNTEEWPDVTRFVDIVIKKHPSYDLLGADWRTIVFIKNQ